MSFQSASKPYKAALELQDLLLQDARREETKPAERAQLARAWKELEGVKRVMRGLPANTSQSIREEKKPRGRKAQLLAQVEPQPEEPEEPGPGPG